MGREAPPNGGPAARIAASYLVSGYSDGIALFRPLAFTPNLRSELAIILNNV